MNVLFTDDTTARSKYSTDGNSEFEYIEVDAGSVFVVDDKKKKYLLFFLEGSVKVRYNEFQDTVFNGGEMIFIPKSADCRGEALTKCSFIVHAYDAPITFCNKAELNSVVSHAEHVKFEFTSLAISEILHKYLMLLKSYLTLNISCKSMHELKHRELFLIPLALYDKRKLAQLFYPILGKSLDFRSKVMTYYTESRTARELAGFCRYSEGHFNELFVAEFGEPPYKWMQRQKAKHIIGRLEQSEVPLKEIADEFNFTSQSHFNRYCKAQFGEPASHVRRKLEAGTYELDSK